MAVLSVPLVLPAADTLASLLILASAGLHAVVNLLWKADRDRWAFRVLVDGAGAVVMLPVAFFVAPPSPVVLLCIAGSVVVHYVYQSLVIAAYRLGDLSAVYPVARGTAPLLTALGAFLFMGERPLPVALLGIAVLVAGIVAFALEGRRGRLANPASARALPLAMAAGAAVAGYTLIDAQGVRAAAGALDYIVWLYLAVGLATTSVVALQRGRALLPALRLGWKPGLLAGLVSLLSYGLALTALRLGATAEVAALRETSVVIGALLGSLVLKEAFGPRRLLAACIVALGALIMHLH